MSRTVARVIATDRERPAPPERVGSWYGESFAKYRGRNGEFSRWLQVFALRSKLGANGAPCIDIMKIAPWVFNEPHVDREVLLSMYRLGVFKHMPAHWSQDEWDWLEIDRDRDPGKWSVHTFRYDEARKVSPIYAVICGGMTGNSLIHHLGVMAAEAGVEPNTLSFWEAMRPLIIMPALSGAHLPDVIAELANPIDVINQEIDR
jgi:hypothetical protein